MAQLATVFQNCSKSLKLILRAQDFGAEYEVLRTEVSIQSLRIRLWGESAGLNDEAASPAPHICNRQEIETTLTQTLQSIERTLSEIESLQQKYDSSPTSPGAKKEAKSLIGWKALFSSPPLTPLHPPVRETPDETTYLTVSKWAIDDATKFEDKIRAVKSLIDGLESISKAAGAFSPTTPPASASHSILLPILENPPPYSSPRPRSRRRTTESSSPSRSPLSREFILPAEPLDKIRMKHFATMTKFMEERPEDAKEPRKPQDRIVQLSEDRFDELVVDIYDELLRRQHQNETTLCLPEDSAYDAKRNKARKKLSCLPDDRFRVLNSDLLTEIARRYPALLEQEQPVSGQLTTSFLRPATTMARPRAQSSPSPAPTLLAPPCQIIKHKSAPTPTPTLTPRIQITPSTSQAPQEALPSTATSIKKPKPSPLNIIPRLSSSASPPSQQQYKSFRLSLSDTTLKVLPYALKKHGVDGNPDEYSLYIAYGAEKERRLGLEEMPLRIMKELAARGERPVFMLRKREEERKRGF